MQKEYGLFEWIGERGIINSIVSFWKQHQDREQIAYVVRLLNAIQWHGNVKPAWVEGITAATLTAEFAVGDFGDCDLLIVCHTDAAATPYCVFVEANITPLSWGAKPTNQRASAGFAGSINGQLCLKYRFARALVSENRNIYPVTEVAEPERLFSAYRHSVLRDPARQPRQLAKGRVLEHLKQLGLLGSDNGSGIGSEAQCYYVALTWDKPEQRIGSDDPDFTPDYLPLFLDETGSDVWATTLNRCGWIGFDAVESALNLRESADYLRALRSIQESSQTEEAAGETEMPDTLDAVTQLCQDVANEMASACGGWLHAVGNTKIGWSIKTTQVVGKVLVHNRGLFVGVRVHELHSPTAPPFLPTKLSVHGVAFHGCYLTGDQHAIIGSEQLAEVLTELKRCWGE